MRDQNHRRPVLCQLQDHTKNLADKFRVQRRSRLIKQQHSGFDRERTGNCGTLLLPARQLGRVVITPIVQSDSSQRLIRTLAHLVSDKSSIWIRDGYTFLLSFDALDMDTPARRAASNRRTIRMRARVRSPARQTIKELAVKGAAETHRHEMQIQAQRTEFLEPNFPHNVDTFYR